MLSFGTGCVKVTPAHDFNDYECGHRNGLESINILTEDGKISANGGEYAVKKINTQINKKNNNIITRNTKIIHFKKIFSF